MAGDGFSKYFNSFRTSSMKIVESVKNVEMKEQIV
jgi:hypothetical protein